MSASKKLVWVPGLLDLQLQPRWRDEEWGVSGEESNVREHARGRCRSFCRRGVRLAGPGTWRTPALHPRFFLLSTFPPCSISRCQCHDSILNSLANQRLLVMIGWSAAASIGFRDHRWLFIHLHRMTAASSVLPPCAMLSVSSAYFQSLLAATCRV